MYNVVNRGKVHDVRLSLQGLPELEHPKYKLARFSGSVVSARQDEAKYANITSGVKIQLHNPKEVLNRWYETIEEMKKDLIE